MITIKPNPTLTYDDVFATWNEPILTVNGVDYDLSEVPDGATVEHPVLQVVERNGNDYTVQVMQPHLHDAPEERRFPVPIIMMTDGEVPFAPNTWPEEEEEELDPDDPDLPENQIVPEPEVIDELA